MEQQKDNPAVQTPRLPGNTYRNPVLFADYSDPDVVRVGDTWYLTASSFCNVPGLPVLSSKNLVDWSLSGYALEQLQPAEHYATPRRGGGVWAPCIRHENGVFSIWYPDPDFGIFRVDATKPHGPWTKPVLVDASFGAIDPCAFSDQDGSKWLVKAWAKSRAGFNNRLTLHRLDNDGKVCDEGITLIEGQNLPQASTSVGFLPWTTIEGPKLYRRGDWYYVLAPAGGVKVGWQAAFRSRSLVGPWEAHVLMDQGQSSINGPHQGALVDAPDGSWYFLHFQDLDAWGRVVHLQPVSWQNDWPLIGKLNQAAGQNASLRGTPVTQGKLPVPDAINSEASSGVLPGNFQTDAQLVSYNNSGMQSGVRAPGPLWQWQANPKDFWLDINHDSGSAAATLRLHCTPQPSRLWENPAVLTRKIEGPACELSLKLDFKPLAEGEEAGLALVGLVCSALVLRFAEGACFLVCKEWQNALKNNESSERIISTHSSSTVWLRMRLLPQVVASEAEPTAWEASRSVRRALLQNWWSPDGNVWHQAGKPLVVREGRWVGAQVGVHALAPGGTASYTATRNGYADFSEASWTVFDAT